MAIQDLSRLYAILNTTKLSKDDPALYQTIYQLIQASLNNDREFSVILGISGSGSGGGGGGGGASSAATYLTVNNELGILPNSRRLLAGAGVSFDDSVGGVRTIDVLASSGDHVVMSDGNNPPAPMDDGAGNFIYVTYTP